ncbi:MAG: hypothetical protein ACTSXL_03835 [Alphaproteobacteria bacterium]|nr:MAG: hypothetical protein B6I23_02280 [Rickettsiaceae bacterium 4572_127]
MKKVVLAIIAFWFLLPTGFSQIVIDSIQYKYCAIRVEGNNIWINDSFLIQKPAEEEEEKEGFFYYYFSNESLEIGDEVSFNFVEKSFYVGNVFGILDGYPPKTCYILLKKKVKTIFNRSLSGVWVDESQIKEEDSNWIIFYIGDDIVVYVKEKNVWYLCTNSLSSFSAKQTFSFAEREWNCSVAVSNFVGQIFGYKKTYTLH